MNPSPFLLLFLCLFIAGTGNSAAQTLVITNKGGGLACYKKIDIDDAYTAARENNMAWLRALQTSGKCFTMRRGAQASLIDYSIWGISRINLHVGSGLPKRVYTGNDNFRLGEVGDRSKTQGKKQSRSVVSTSQSPKSKQQPPARKPKISPTTSRVPINSIKNRCQSQMGAYGARMVKVCVDRDVEAYKALDKYPARHQSIIDRCKRVMLSAASWRLVKVCVDKDIEAAIALQQMVDDSEPSVESSPERTSLQTDRFLQVSERTKKLIKKSDDTVREVALEGTSGIWRVIVWVFKDTATQYARTVGGNALHIMELSFAEFGPADYKVEVRRSGRTLWKGIKRKRERRIQWGYE